jgi:undecaprenyl-diphosphatase
MGLNTVKEAVYDITGLGGNPVYLVAAFLFYFTNPQVTWQLLLGLVVCYATTLIIRLAWFRQRPDKSKVTNFYERYSQSSFPSMHAMRTAVLAVVLMFAFQNLVIQIVLGALLVLTMYSRVYLKRHYVSDVIVGAILGIIAGVLLGVYI